MEIDQLRELFEGIRDENRRYANTATRIGNAFLALLSYIGTPGQDKYIRKDIEDFASGHISFNDGLSIPTGKAAKIGAGSITWDSANNCFHFSHGIYSDDFISALGISNGMSSGGSFDLLQDWNKYVEDTAKSMALSAYLGKDLLDRVTSLEKGQKGHKITISGSGNVLVNVAESNDGSTLTFTKGNIDLSGYATKTELTELLTAKADKSIRVNAGTGLAGGGSLSADITLSLATVGTAGTYTKVTVDKYGRVTGHSSLAAADIPTLEISKINGLQVELNKKLNKTDFGASFATEMAKWFAKDSDGNIYVADKKGFYSNSFISALGLSASTGGGGSFDLLQDWNKYVDETAKSTALSAYLGKDLLDRIKAVENGRKGHAIVVSGSGNVLVNVAESSDGSTLTFTKGNIDLSGYATKTELTELLKAKADKSIRVNSGTGLAGGGSLSADITLSLATVGTAGTYTKVTVDKYGRVTGHSSLTAADIPTLEISKINGLRAELYKKLNKTDFGASFATEMAKWFAKDSDGNIYVVNEKGFYSNSFISALGLNNSEGGTGGTSYDRLDNWADYAEEKATWVLSAKLGNELNSRVSALEAGGATSVVTSGSGNVVTAVTKSGTVITATKGITALTSHQAIYALTLQGNGSTIGTFNPKSGNATINITPSNIGAATSGHKHTISILTDLGEEWNVLLKEAPSEYVTRWPVFSEITDTPSTLAGYGITDGVNGVTVTGNGNAVTAASVNGHTLTLTKGSTFLLSSAYTAADVLSKLKTVDGSGSGLDADLLDGVHLDGLFTGLRWSTQTLSITIGGVSKTVNIPYATASVAGLVSTGTQTFGGLKTFNSGLVVPAGKSLKIGDGTITWDSAKGCFHFSNGLYSDEFVSALGLSASTGGGGASYDRLDAWGDYDSSKASWVLSAKLGYDLNTRVSALEGGSAMNFEKSGTGNALTGFSKSGNTVTFTTGTFLTSHQRLYTLTLQRNGEGIGSYVPTADKVININACTAITMPKGFTVGTLSSVGVIGVTFASGYSLPTTAKQQQWDTAYSFVSSIMGSDADGVIDKWNEIISFLDGIGDSSTLEGLLNDINGNVTAVGNRVVTLEGYFTNGIAKQAAKTTGTLSINGKSFNGSANITVGTMGVAYGGTGKSSVASGSMLYASAANVYSELATTSFGRNLLKANSGVVVTGLNADTLDGVHLGGIFTDMSWSTQKLSLTIGGVTNSVTIPYATTSVPGLVSTGAQTFAGAKTFNAGLIVPSGQSIKIGGGTITWDSAKGCFHISHGLYSDSFISALGVSASTGGGGGSSLDRLDDWDDYSTDRATWVLSAKLGADLNTRLKSVEAGSATSVVMAGSGNVVTSITKSGTVITATKGITALTSHQSIYSLTIQGNGNTIGKFNPKSGNATINITPSNIGAAASGHTHSYLPLSGGTLTGDLKFSTIAGWPTPSGETYPIDSDGISWSGSSDSAKIFYRVTGSDHGNLVFQTGDDTNSDFIFENTLGGQLALLAGSGSLTVKSAVTAPTFNGSLNGNAASATKLATARNINGTSFNGTANITTSYWGTARNIYIQDATAAHTGAAVSVNGSTNVNLKLPSTITATLSGNASSATKLATARTINGTSFDGTANITTAKWGTARNIYIRDASQAHTGAAVSVDGSATEYLLLPSTITATLVGNADTATNADKLDGVHLLQKGSRNGVLRSWSRGSFTTVNQYFGNGAVVVIDPAPTDSSELWANTNIFSIGDAATRNWQMAFGYGSDTIKVRRIWDGPTYGSWKQLAFIDSNVASATKLATARTLWGRSFDGTANVSGSLSGVGTITGSGTLALVGNDDIYLKRGGVDSNSLVLSGNVFKPFNSANNNIDLGSSSAKWRNLYVAGTANVGSITIGSGKITWDSAKGCFHFSHGLYSDSFVSALGANSSASGGGGSYERLDSWSDYSSDKATWVLSALLGHELNSRVSALEAGGATSVVTSGSGNVVTAVTKSGTVITVTKGITALTSHQAIYALTLQGNGSTIGKFNPKSANATINLTAKNLLLGRGLQNPQTGRTQNFGRLYSYYTSGSAHENAPTTYTAVIGFGSDNKASVEIAGGWTYNMGLWYRALRDVEDDWFGWRKVLDESNYASVLDSRYYTESEINTKLTNGSVTKVGTASVGGTVKPIYLNGGVPTALSANAGNSTHPVYLNAGAITQCGSTLDVSVSGGAAYLSSSSRMDYGWNGLNYFNADLDAGCAAKVNDSPTSAWWHILRFNHANSSGYYTDLAIPFNSDSIYWKTVRNGKLAHSAWARVLDSLNYTSYTVTKTGGGASGTWGIGISGNAATASKLTTTNAGSSTRPVYFSNGIPVGGAYSFGNGNGNASVNNGTVCTNLNADMLDGTHKSGLLTALSSSSATNLSLTVGGTTKTIADLYATQAVNADTLDNLHASSFLRCDGTNSIGLSGGNGNTAGWRLVMEKTCGGWTICNIVFSVTSRHTGQGVMNIGFHTTNEEGTSYAASINLFGSTASNGSSPWRAFYNTSTKKFRLFWYYNDYNAAQINVLSRSGFNTPTNGTWYEALPSDNGTELTIYYNNATTATKLLNARNINGTSFNGTTDITTAKWGTARNIYIRDASQAHTGAAVSVDGSATEYLLLPSTITATLSGNASSATKLATARNINGTAFNGTADITTANWGTARNIYIRDASQAHTGAAVSVDTARTLWGRSFDGRANVSGDMTGVGNVTPSANGTRNLGSATSRWANIYTNSIDVYGSTPVIRFHYNNASTGTDFIAASSNGLITISNVLRIYQSSGVYVDKGEFHVAGKVVIGSTPSTYVLNVQGEIGVTGTYGGMRIIPGYVSGEAFRIDPITSSGASNSNRITLLQNGNVCIGGPTATSYKLDVSGSIYSRANIIAAGAVTALVVSSSSDARLKNIIRDACPAVEDVADAPAVEFAWKKDGSRAVGSIAQYWQGVLPQAVHEERGYLAMQYDVIAMLASIANARRILSIEKKIRELEAEVKRLKTA